MNDEHEQPITDGWRDRTDAAEAVGPNELEEAWAPEVGDGTPATAPHKLPTATLRERAAEFLLRKGK